MRLLAANVYYWGRREQSLFLRHHVASWLDEQLGRGTVRWLWFDRFDARGPHLFLVFCLTDGAGEEVEEALRTYLARALEEDPSQVSLTTEELERRHRECRGKALCALDRQPGMAPNNSFTIVSHPPTGRPLGWTKGLRSPGDFQDHLGILVRRCIDQLPDGGTAAGLPWVAAVDRHLTALCLRRGVGGGAYWRAHLSTLLIGFDDPPPEAQERLLDQIPRAVGARNWKTFQEVWAKADEGVPKTSLLPSPRPLLESVFAGAEDPRRRWPLLRELIHTTLKQLGIPVAQQIPLVLFALDHHRRQEGSR